MNMAKSSKKAQPVKRDKDSENYRAVLDEITELLQSTRRTSARTVNTIMTAVYWEIGRRVVEYEQSGRSRAAYGEKLLERLSTDLGARFGRGFGLINLRQMRRFYLEWPRPQIRQTLSDESQHPSRAGHALFPCLGLITSNCLPSKRPRRALSTRRRLCAAAGACVSSSGRSIRSSTSAPPSLRSTARHCPTRKY